MRENQLAPRISVLTALQITIFTTKLTDRFNLALMLCVTRDLQNNNLSGPIPDWLASMTNLTELWVHIIHLTFTLWPSSYYNFWADVNIFFFATEFCEVLQGTCNSLFCVYGVMGGQFWTTIISSRKIPTSESKLFVDMMILLVLMRHTLKFDTFGSRH